MGTWSASILANDTSPDTKDEFLEENCLNQEEAKGYKKKRPALDIDDEDRFNVMFALASMYEVGQLDESFLS